MQKKKIILIFAMLMVMCFSLFAQNQGGSIDQLDKWGQTIVSLFTSTWLKAVCIVALIGLAIGMITAGRSEPGMMKKFAPWLIGVIILLSATSIVGYFFEGADLSTITQLTERITSMV
ncbi:TrbC/VirB2 family protein [Treponema pedis]|uniref:TrbC/VirB2 family protein n=1 Tax=Treponema pedis TaxID=409322 RepID=UPI0003FC8BFB|nr:TrbC/VirB2 family protein [Treponema pedis]